MSKSDNTGKLLAGLIFGAAAGIAAGLLLAPEKGEVTREKLKKKAEDLSENLDGYTKDISTKAKKFAEEVEEKIKNFDKPTQPANDVDDNELGV